MMFVRRTLWRAKSLSIKDEPLMKSLIQYRQDKDRVQVDFVEDANLVSSLLTTGKHMPIIDLDSSHELVPSTTEGHSHLYLNVEMSRFKLFVLMGALYYTGVIELGHFVWTLRRGATFVRLPGAQKTEDETPKPQYGWFFKIKK